MGDVIRNSAAVEDIFADVRVSLANAVAKGGAAKEIAEDRVAPVVTMVDTVEAELKQARDVAAPLAAELKAENDRADALLARTYDDIWNDVGRPANDRVLSLLFPGGVTYYADGSTEHQPQRMELLAQLIERGLHPKLTQPQNLTYATRIRDAAKALADDIAAASLPSARVALLERIRTAMGRAAQFELASLKRAYKNEGMSESEIHGIIPDRPVAKKTKDGAKKPDTTVAANPPGTTTPQ